jgi:hypothetical protein
MIDPAHIPGEYVLASHTTEALSIVMRAGIVYKHLRPHDSFRDQSAESRVRQLRLRAVESRLWHEINTMTFDEANNCVISRYIDGRMPTRCEVLNLRERFAATRRGYIEDVGRYNVLMVNDQPILIDFSINERHVDFGVHEVFEQVNKQ